MLVWFEVKRREREKLATWSYRVNLPTCSFSDSLPREKRVFSNNKLFVRVRFKNETFRGDCNSQFDAFFEARKLVTDCTTCSAQKRDQGEKRIPEHNFNRTQKELLEKPKKTN